jgi:hypothetical protein
MSPPSQNVPSPFTAEQFATHFTTKIDNIRTATASAPAASLQSRLAPPFETFYPVTTEEVCRILARVSAKHCTLDPIPTWLIKRAADVMAPVLSVICNASLQAGYLPDVQKQAIVLPRLKKPTLDNDDIGSYRPISNLSFLSKLVERVVASRFSGHAELNKLLPVRQSAYRRHHSTETAVVSVLNDIIRAIDNGEVAALVLLDLSAAFDTVDHAILLDVLQHRFAVDAVPLLWLTSYLTDRTQIYTVDGIQSAPIHLNCSVPQGSVLGPLEFISYTEDIVELLERHRIVHHLFADDKQLLKTTTVADID